MFDSFERTVAFRYLKSPRQEGFVSVIAGFSFLGITLGVATLIIVMAVMNGFRAELYRKLVGMRGHVMVLCPPSLTDWRDVYLKIKSQPNVVNAYPILEKQAVLTFSGQARGVGVLGINPKDFRSEHLTINGKPAAQFENLTRDHIALGTRLAQAIGATQGSKVTLMLPGGAKTPFGNMPKQISLEVSSIFEIGMHEFDKNMVFLPLETAQSFFGAGDTVNHIDILLNDLKNSAKVIEKLQGELPGNPEIVDWRHGDSQVFQAVQIEKNVMFVILTLIIVIAAFNVISSLIMLVKDKNRDIAILRTMGASRENILKIFFLTGSCVGIGGTLAGLVIGVSFATHIETIRRLLEKILKTDLFSAEVYFLSKLPAEIVWSEVFLVALITLTVTFLATFYPAYKAARLDPVEALRL